MERGGFRRELGMCDYMVGETHNFLASEDEIADGLLKGLMRIFIRLVTSHILSLSISLLCRIKFKEIGIRRIAIKVCAQHQISKALLQRSCRIQRRLIWGLFILVWDTYLILSQVLN